MLTDMKRIVVFFGMIASGKSTLGQAWAARRGASYYNTDRVRKELAGLQATDRRPGAVDHGIYSVSFTEKTYREMLDRATRDFEAGQGMVVLDGSYSRRINRDQVRDMAGKVGASCLFLYCVCSDEEVKRRLAQRLRDPLAVSDGHWEIYLHQKQVFETIDPAVEGDCHTINTEQGLECLLVMVEGLTGAKSG